MKIAVIGLGRFGRSLALSLAERGAEVIAIDKDREAVDAVKDKVALAVILDSEDEDALKAQGVDKVDVAVVSIGGGDIAKGLADEVSIAQKAIGDEKETPSTTQRPRRVAHELAGHVIVHPHALVERWVGDHAVEATGIEAMFGDATAIEATIKTLP